MHVKIPKETSKSTQRVCFKLTEGKMWNYKKYMKNNFWEKIFQNSENKVFGGKMHKEIKVLFETDIKRKKRINISIIF